MGWFWACGFSVVFWGPFWEAVWSCAAALSFPARRTCLNAEAICTGITRRKKIRIRAPATRHWPRSMRDPNPFACHPPPRAALDCRILARGDCGPAKLAVGSLINCHWCAVGVLGLPLLGRRAAGFPGAGSRVSFAAARSATTSAGNRFIVRDACVFKMHSCWHAYVQNIYMCAFLDSGYSNDFVYGMVCGMWNCLPVFDFSLGPRLCLWHMRSSPTRK